MRSLVVLSLLLGCNSGGGGIVVVDAAVDTFGAGCRFECVGLLECRNGLAYQRGHEPVPCELWQGACPGSSRGCSGGCDVEFTTRAVDDDWTDRLPLFCAETPAAKVGDSCTDECLPTRAVADAQDKVQQQYLACESGTCVAASPPTVPDYLGTCTPLGMAWMTPGATGISDAGAGRACLVAWFPATQASRVVSTIYCVGDWQCPQGSSCDSLPDLDQPSIKRAVCRPGARGAPLASHLPP